MAIKPLTKLNNKDSVSSNELLAPCKRYSIIHMIIIDFQYTAKLETKSILTSFGKMILSKNDTRPQYNFSRAKRLKDSLTGNDYLYHPTEEKNYKYSKVK